MALWTWILVLCSGLLLLPSAVRAQSHCPGGLYAPHGAALVQTRAVVGTPERWGSGPLTEVTWSFVETSDSVSGEAGVIVDPIINGQNGFPQNARALVREAFIEWSRVADIRFTERTDGTDGQIRVGAHAFTGTILGHAFFPGQSAIAGDVHMDNDRVWTEPLFLAAVTHEIGHAIGLNHILDQGQVAGVIMNASIASVAERLTRKDIAYLQSVYGPPIPTITSVQAQAQSVQVNWTYPTEPMSRTTPTRFHGGTVDTSGNEVIVDINDSTDLMDLLNFEVRSTVLAQQTLRDGAEDNETRLFDEFFQDDAIDTVWVRDSFRVFDGSRSYRIEPGNVSFAGLYQLPQLTPVEATSSSTLRFQRAFFFTEMQEMRYLLSVDGGDPITLAIETGSADFNQADSPFTLREFDLSAYSGSTISVTFEYNHGSFFITSDNGVSVDSIELVDVLAESGPPTTHSTTIAPTATSFDITGLSAGQHKIQIRTLFDNAPASEFSAAQRTGFSSVAGDVNGDGRVTPLDALMIFEHVLSMAFLDATQQQRANVDTADNNITLADGLCVFQIFLALASCVN